MAAGMAAGRDAHRWRKMLSTSTHIILNPLSNFKPRGAVTQNPALQEEATEKSLRTNTDQKKDSRLCCRTNQKEKTADCATGCASMPDADAQGSLTYHPEQVSKALACLTQAMSCTLLVLSELAGLSNCTVPKF
jgi:hypothetical protein